ncbi:M28 family peptidase [Chitinophaga japonensis]|uniref:Peptidase M28-like protein n=1 Tax=Chitinophaga japonensis TaxID=104662 RepID=A0A562TEY8_CHIJA|nr:M28 family peptidase [Chitinophaga japonensis]TWI91834.1 peptidase M28-like protein [Chitinophaga japonensis]
MALLTFACQPSANNGNSDSEDNTTISAVKVPAFNADSAYAYTAKQVSFGPRIPNTPAQEQCADWLIQTLRPLADTVYVQRTTVTGPQKTALPCINIIGVFNPAATQRILLLAHWDTRPHADQDAFDKTKKLDGADDGASGVAVLLELARQFHREKPNIGVDLLLTDVEDSGVSEEENSFCLGTQYWAHHPHVPGYKANYGILLDMVGGRGSQFYMEATSQQYALGPMKAFWDVANKLGYSDYFRYEGNGAAITDDHVYVNTIAHIPTFDIIALQPSGSFAPHWHTENDNMSVIDPRTLQAVGQTLMQVVYAQPF